MKINAFLGLNENPDGDTKIRDGELSEMRNFKITRDRHLQVRPGTFHKGSKAPQCAGVIHSDFERGFIRAEIIKYEDYIAYGSEAAVKEAGKMHIEGKEYVFQDGDIVVFRFNV